MTNTNSLVLCVLDGHGEHGDGVSNGIAGQFNVTYQLEEIQYAGNWLAKYTLKTNQYWQAPRGRCDSRRTAKGTRLVADQGGFRRPKRGGSDLKGQASGKHDTARRSQASESN
jgi:hypothetical protein